MRCRARYREPSTCPNETACGADDDFLAALVFDPDVAVDARGSVAGRYAARDASSRDAKSRDENGTAKRHLAAPALDPALAERRAQLAEDERGDLRADRNGCLEAFAPCCLHVGMDRLLVSAFEVVEPELARDRRQLVAGTHRVIENGSSHLDSLRLDAGVDAFTRARHGTFEGVEHVGALGAKNHVAAGVGRFRGVNDELAIVLDVFVRDP